MIVYPLTIEEKTGGGDYIISADNHVIATTSNVTYREAVIEMVRRANAYYDLLDTLEQVVFD